MASGGHKKLASEEAYGECDEIFLSVLGLPPCHKSRCNRKYFKMFSCRGILHSEEIESVMGANITGESRKEQSECLRKLLLCLVSCQETAP